MRTFLAASLPPSAIILAVVIVVLVFSLILVFLSRYRRCPSDKVMVIYGKVGHQQGRLSPVPPTAFTAARPSSWPVIQAYEYLDLTPMSISVDLKNALSRQNIRIDVPARFTVGISTEPGTMQNAAERLLGLKLHGNSGAGQGHHLRSAAPGYRHHGHRGDQHRPRQIPGSGLLATWKASCEKIGLRLDQRQRHRYQRRVRVHRRPG